MKLVIAIVQNDDAYTLSDALMDKKFSVTKLSTTGGFLKINNSTLLIGTDDEKVQVVIDIIKQICHSREKIISAPLPSSYAEIAMQSYPININIGGATIFVVDVDRFEKI